MRRLVLLVGCVLAFAGTAAAKDAPASSSSQCGLSTPYNVQVDDGGVWLYRGEGSPREIFFHDGTLSVDQQVREVGQADAARLRQLEDGARALMPQVADIARQSVGISYDALADAVRAMTGSGRKVRNVERHRDRALAHVDQSLGRGRWDQDVFDAKFQAEVAGAIGQITRSLVRSALWMAMTGRAGQLEARADRLDGIVDRRTEARTAALERQAHALCDQVVRLRTLQDALEYRYRGEPLAMLAPAERARPGTGAVPGAGAEPGGDHEARGDVPSSNAVAPVP